MGVFDEFQIPYSALERQHENWITVLSNAGVGTVIRGGAAKGEPGASSQGPSERWEKFAQAKLDDLREEGETRTAFILRHTLSHPQVHTTIVGTQNNAHLQENMKSALLGPLSPDVYAEANRRLDEIGETPAKES